MGSDLEVKNQVTARPGAVLVLIAVMDGRQISPQHHVQYVVLYTDESLPAFALFLCSLLHHSSLTLPLYPTAPAEMFCELGPGAY